MEKGDMWINLDKEFQASLEAAENLIECAWAKPLLLKPTVKNTLNFVRRELGLNDDLHQTKAVPHNQVISDLFEIRFAYQLQRVGAMADIEFKTNVGNSSVDFRVIGNPDWYIELVCLQESKSLQKATHRGQWAPGFEYQARLIGSDASFGEQTEQQEMIRAQGCICSKVYDNEKEKPTKFPALASAIHMIVVDVRGYLGRGGDKHDWRQMANGPIGLSKLVVKPQPKHHNIPIYGLFQIENPSEEAKFMRERIHFIWFIREKTFEDDEITKLLEPISNPHLFDSCEEIKRILTGFPLYKAPL